MARENGRIGRTWLWVALCIGLIWTLSGESFGAGTTGRLVALLRHLWPGIDEGLLQDVHFAARKGAHVAEYGLLGLLAFRAWRLSLPGPVGFAVALALLLVLLVAGVDELRQSRLATRTGSPADVLLDLAGGALGVTAIASFGRPRPADPPPPEPS